MTNYNLNVNKAALSYVITPNKGLLLDDIGSAVRVVSATQPLSGAVSVNADGTFTYTPDYYFDDIVNDTFVYTISDSFGQTASAAVCINVDVEQRTKIYNNTCIDNLTTPPTAIHDVYIEASEENLFNVQCLPETNDSGLNIGKESIIWNSYTLPETEPLNIGDYIISISDESSNGYVNTPSTGPVWPLKGTPGWTTDVQSFNSIVPNGAENNMLFFQLLNSRAVESLINKGGTMPGDYKYWSVPSDAGIGNIPDNPLPSQNLFFNSPRPGYDGKTDDDLLNHLKSSIESHSGLGPDVWNFLKSGRHKIFITYDISGSMTSNTVDYALTLFRSHLESYKIGYVIYKKGGESWLEWMYNTYRNWLGGRTQESFYNPYGTSVPVYNKEYSTFDNPTPSNSIVYKNSFDPSTVVPTAETCSTMNIRGKYYTGDKDFGLNNTFDKSDYYNSIIGNDPLSRRRYAPSYASTDTTLIWKSNNPPTDTSWSEVPFNSQYPAGIAADSYAGTGRLLNKFEFKSQNAVFNPARVSIVPTQKNSCWFASLGSNAVTYIDNNVTDSVLTPTSTGDNLLPFGTDAAVKYQVYIKDNSNSCIVSYPHLSAGYQKHSLNYPFLNNRSYGTFGISTAPSGTTWVNSQFDQRLIEIPNNIYSETIYNQICAAGADGVLLSDLGSVALSGPTALQNPATDVHLPYTFFAMQVDSTGGIWGIINTKTTFSNGQRRILVWIPDPENNPTNSYYIDLKSAGYASKTITKTEAELYEDWTYNNNTWPTQQTIKLGAAGSSYIVDDYNNVNTKPNLYKIADFSSTHQPNCINRCIYDSKEYIIVGYSDSVPFLTPFFVINATDLRNDHNFIIDELNDPGLGKPHIIQLMLGSKDFKNTLWTIGDYFQDTYNRPDSWSEDRHFINAPFTANHITTHDGYIYCSGAGKTYKINTRIDTMFSPNPNDIEYSVRDSGGSLITTSAPTFIYSNFTLLQRANYNPTDSSNDGLLSFNKTSIGIVKSADGHPYLLTLNADHANCEIYDIGSEPVWDNNTGNNYGDYGIKFEQLNAAPNYIYSDNTGYDFGSSTPDYGYIRFKAISNRSGGNAKWESIETFFSRSCADGQNYTDLTMPMSADLYLLSGVSEVLLGSTTVNINDNISHTFNPSIIASAIELRVDLYREVDSATINPPETIRIDSIRVGWV